MFLTDVSVWEFRNTPNDCGGGWRNRCCQHGTRPPRLQELLWNLKFDNITIIYSRPGGCRPPAANSHPFLARTMLHPEDSASLHHRSRWGGSGSSSRVSQQRSDPFLVGPARRSGFLSDTFTGPVAAGATLGPAAAASQSGPAGPGRPCLQHKLPRGRSSPPRLYLGFLVAGRRSGPGQADCRLLPTRTILFWEAGSDWVYPWPSVRPSKHPAPVPGLSAMVFTVF